MAINITRRERNKQDYQIAAIGSAVSLILSIAALVIFIKSEES